MSERTRMCIANAFCIHVFTHFVPMLTGPLTPTLPIIPPYWGFTEHCSRAPVPMSFFSRASSHTEQAHLPPLFRSFRHIGGLRSTAPVLPYPCHFSLEHPLTQNRATYPHSSDHSTILYNNISIYKII